MPSHLECRGVAWTGCVSAHMLLSGKHNLDVRFVDVVDSQSFAALLAICHKLRCCPGRAGRCSQALRSRTVQQSL
jgi:hypothetical protein